MGRCCVRTWQLLPVCETSFEPLQKDPLFFYSLCFIGLPQDRLQGRCWALGGGVFCPKIKSLQGSGGEAAGGRFFLLSFCG